MLISLSHLAAMGKNLKEYLNQSETRRCYSHEYKGKTNTSPFMKVVYWTCMCFQEQKTIGNLKIFLPWNAFRLKLQKNVWRNTLESIRNRVAKRERLERKNHRLHPKEFSSNVPMQLKVFYHLILAFLHLRCWCCCSAQLSFQVCDARLGSSFLKKTNKQTINQEKTFMFMAWSSCLIPGILQFSDVAQEVILISFESLSL